LDFLDITQARPATLMSFTPAKWINPRPGWWQSQEVDSDDAHGGTRVEQFYWLLSSSFHFCRARCKFWCRDPFAQRTVCITYLRIFTAPPAVVVVFAEKTAQAMFACSHYPCQTLVVVHPQHIDYSGGQK